MSIKLLYILFGYIIAALWIKVEKIIIERIPVKITIEYCTKWNYQPRASRLEEDLKKISGVEVELIPSTGGVFEITADGKSIFSKKEMKRFPEEGEIAGLLG